MKYFHVDVFSNKPYSGNGLTIFTDTKDLEKSFMQTVTQEMRQFESIFLHQVNATTFRAFIFTMEEELDFAGHPVIGAAAILHDLYSKEKEQNSFTIELNAKPVTVKTVKHANYYSAQMNQGKAEFGAVLTKEQEIDFLNFFNLTVADKFDDLPFQVVTTGLPYLILPVKTKSLSKVKVTIPNLEKKLEEINAKFFYVLDIENLQGRTWDNFGLVEDIATGSAAGPAGAYLVKNNFAEADTPIILRQGDFLGRPSKIKIVVS
ncbi:MAG: PhzF family phenazine biosynthesis protein, partial [Sphingobacteriales bacterium]